MWGLLSSLGLNISPTEALHHQWHPGPSTTKSPTRPTQQLQLRPAASPSHDFTRLDDCCSSYWHTAPNPFFVATATNISRYETFAVTKQATCSKEEQQEPQGRCSQREKIESSLPSKSSFQGTVDSRWQQRRWKFNTVACSNSAGSRVAANNSRWMFAVSRFYFWAIIRKR